MSVWALLMAAGSGTRMGLKENKVFAAIGSVPILQRSVRAFEGEVDGVLVVARAEDMDAVHALVPDVPVVEGGATRQASVLCGLRALPQAADIVLVHDAARPFVDRETIRRCIEGVRRHGSGVAAVPVKDTIKQVRTDGSILGTPPRETLWIAQTPQAFHPAALRQALETLTARGDAVTDDASAMELTGQRVWLVEGTYANIKMTTPEDLAVAEGLLGGLRPMRIGHGYDVHRLAQGRRLVLCGVEIPFDQGLLGHSDADVALHALTDALLGAAAMGDIGRHFPDSDPALEGADSAALLGRVRAMLSAQGFLPGNVDITIIAQRPKLAPYIEAMRASVAAVLDMPLRNVNVKATTSEGLGFEGEGRGISAHAVATLLETGSAQDL